MSQLHNPQPESWLVGFFALTDFFFLDITFDTAMTQNLNPVDPSVWIAKVNGTIKPISSASWQGAAILRVGVVWDAQDNDVLSMQCTGPDSTVYDLDGCPTLGFGPIEDTYIVGKSPLLGSVDEVIDYDKFEQQYKVT